MANIQFPGSSAYNLTGVQSKTERTPLGPPPSQLPPQPTDGFAGSAPVEIPSRPAPIEGTEAPHAAAPGHFKKWLRNAMVGLTLAAVTAGAVGQLGGPAGPALHHVGQDVGIVHVDKTAGKTNNAPTTLRMEMEQHSGAAMEKARFGGAPTVRDFGRLPLKFSPVEGNDVRTGPDGASIQHHYKYDQLQWMDGKVVYSSSTEKVLRDAFPLQGESNWSTYSQLQPAGQFKNYLSVLVTDGGNTGGAHNQMSQSLVTLDSQTGKQVNLDQLLQPHDFDKVVGQVATSLNSPRASNYYLEGQELRDQVNQNFAAYRDTDGSLKFLVMVPAQFEADHGKVAEFVFTAPSYFMQQ